MSSMRNLIANKNSTPGQNQISYQPIFPLKYDETYGPYRPLTSLESSIQRDFEYLLMTNPGEWPMNPQMGIGIRSLLFEVYGSRDVTGIQARIQDQLSRFLPRVQLLSAELLATDEQKDQHFLNIRLNYSILGSSFVQTTTDLGAEGEVVLSSRVSDNNSTSFVDRSQNLQSHIVEV